jgi:hypothetical protein
MPPVRLKRPKDPGFRSWSLGNDITLTVRYGHPPPVLEAFEPFLAQMINYFKERRDNLGEAQSTKRAALGGDTEKCTSEPVRASQRAMLRMPERHGFRQYCPFPPVNGASLLTRRAERISKSRISASANGNRTCNLLVNKGDGSNYRPRSGERSRRRSRLRV